MGSEDSRSTLFCIFQSHHNFATVSRLWNFKVIWKHTVFQLSGNIQFSSYLEITSCDKGRYNLLCYLFEQYSPFISGEVLHTIKQRVRHNIKAYNLEVTELQNYTIIWINGIMALILLVTSTVIGLITYSLLSQWVSQAFYFWKVPF